MNDYKKTIFLLFTFWGIYQSGNSQPGFSSASKLLFITDATTKVLSVKELSKDKSWCGIYDKNPEQLYNDTDLTTAKKDKAVFNMLMLKGCGSRGDTIVIALQKKEQLMNVFLVMDGISDKGKLRNLALFSRIDFKEGDYFINVPSALFSRYEFKDGISKIFPKNGIWNISPQESNICKNDSAIIYSLMKHNKIVEHIKE